MRRLRRWWWPCCGGVLSGVGLVFGPGACLRPFVRDGFLACGCSMPVACRVGARGGGEGLLWVLGVCRVRRP